MRSIRRMPGSAEMGPMRVGVTRQMVAVASRQRGVKTRRHPYGRPNPPTAETRALVPAGEAHEHQVFLRRNG
jgi:hypothetical protein